MILYLQACLYIVPVFLMGVVIGFLISNYYNILFFKVMDILWWWYDRLK